MLTLFRPRSFKHWRFLILSDHRLVLRIPHILVIFFVTFLHQIIHDFLIIFIFRLFITTAFLFIVNNWRDHKSLRSIVRLMGHPIIIKAILVCRVIRNTHEFIPHGFAHILGIHNKCFTRFMSFVQSSLRVLVHERYFRSAFLFVMRPFYFSGRVFDMILFHNFLVRTLVIDGLYNRHVLLIISYRRESFAHRGRPLFSPQALVLCRNPGALLWFVHFFGLY